jgi:serine/threonine-protein kinase
MASRQLSPRVTPVLRPTGPRRGADDPLIGMVIDNRYVIRERIAKSGASRVYRAEQPKLERFVAVKVLMPREDHPDYAQNKRRFQREASALARLSHPITVRVHDHGELRGMLYLVMEFIDGFNLRQYFRAHSPSPELSVEVIDQLAQALGEAHSLGIVHRDLKPANVFLRGHSPQDARVRLVDFGIAKDIEDNTEFTGVDVVLGTPWYMAPEQCMGERVDGRTDIYALGVMLYRMLMGRTPYGDLRGAAVLVAHINSPPPAFAELQPERVLPPVVEWTVGRCLAKKPEDRFADVAQLRIALHACKVALQEPSLPIHLGLRAGTVEVSEDVAELLYGAPTLLTQDLPVVRRRRQREWVPWGIAAVSLLIAVVSLASSG